ncbi:hypothetical protein [Confluentibacter citreus]|uniref:hypothetical protein n=1 Tax=Confluentibacter citreus TaxID=2007307 RepID=UPI000C28D56D|nr:hypothetical protein [Confluentibacter citreus]
MKYYLIIACVSFFTLTNCSIGDINNDIPQVTRVLWNLNNVSGGIDGVDNDFASGVIVWEFKNGTSTLTVSNTNNNAAIEDGLNSGTYSFSVNKIGNVEYLTINSSEFGSLTFTTNDTVLIINQNETSTGTGNDGYIYTFTKSVIVEN